MNYQECRAYIDDAAKYGSVLGLDNMYEMLKRLGNPQDEIPYVHVAGTNGKGSTIAFLYTTLTRAGYKVGRYVSPTLYSYRERLEIAGRRISREEFAGYVTRISQAIEEMTQAGLNHPTPFEIETAAAFLYFKEEKCDLVLLETGMGGNLDATNVIRNTKLAILVSVSMDHMSFLGNTLGEIAEKKAGIIKPGCHVVTTKQKEEASLVIEAVCERLGVPCTVSDPDEGVMEAESVFGQRFSYKGEEFEISLAGVYQKENAVLALNALEELDRLGWHTTMEQRKDGLLHTSWRGRFSVICKKPLFIVDGAHNPGAADKMAESIQHYFKGKRLIYIMGVFADKEYDLVLEKTAHFAEKIFTIETPGNPRALPAEKLAEAALRYNSSAKGTESIRDAVEKAFACADGDENSVILAFGSLSFIGELTEAVEEHCRKLEESKITDLQECRRRIDEIDNQIVELFEKRMKVCEDVAKYKIHTGKKVLDPEREHAKLEEIRKKAHGEFNALGAQELFQQIMAISRKRQYQLLTEFGPREKEEFQMVDRLPRNNVNVVFQGVEGAYSYGAMRAYFQEDIKSYHVKLFRDAMEEVAAGRADYAVLPIENSTAGIVADIYDLLTEYNLFIVGEQVLKVEHVLLGLPDAELSHISCVYSHPQGLAQCKEYLEVHRSWKTAAVSNTAAAAKKVSEEQDKTHAAIASRDAGEFYNLKILAENICRNDSNVTRFIILSKKPVYEIGSSRISVCFEARHESGTLYNVLSHMIYNGLNMTKIESRPIPGKTWEYRFFVDFEGNLRDSAVKNALRGMEAETSYLKILGNY